MQFWMEIWTMVRRWVPVMLVIIVAVGLVLNLTERSKPVADIYNMF